MFDTSDMLSLTPQNLVLSPVYKDLSPINIWNDEHDGVDTAPVQCVTTANGAWVCSECGKPVRERPMTNAEALIIGVVVVLVIGFFTLGFKNIFRDD